MSFSGRFLQPYGTYFLTLKLYKLINLILVNIPAHSVLEYLTEEICSEIPPPFQLILGGVHSIYVALMNCSLKSLRVCYVSDLYPLGTWGQNFSLTQRRRS